MDSVIKSINGIVWGPAMLLLILGTGLFLQLGLRFLPLRKVGLGFIRLWRGRHAGSDSKGDISPFKALMTSLSATIGTGNIAGVATAIFLGGPGALFWMWCTALVGMATKYAEAVLAVHYREVDVLGNHVGGPMYYIKNGLGKRWLWLAVLFAVFGSIAGFGIGNTVQANSVAAALHSTMHIPYWVTGVVLMLVVGIVILGGIKRIAKVANTIVPTMGLAYIGLGLLVIFLNIGQIPEAIRLVFHYAFSPAAASGGFAGASVWAAMRFGVARGVFSNEAGLGSAPIAHAAAKTKGPVDQGLIAMLGTFIDTILVCSITGFAILTSGAWSTGVTGSALTSAAFATSLPHVGGYIVSISLVFFAFTTMLGWAYYCEQCVEYLLGVKAILVFRVLWVLVIPVGAMAHLGLVWLVADTLNALMAIPNLIALLLLSPVVFKLSRDYFQQQATAEGAQSSQLIKQAK